MVEFNPNKPSAKNLMPSGISSLMSGGTKDYKIGDVKQGGIFDCGTIAATKAILDTEAGAELIESLFDYNFESATLHFPDGDYNVPNSKLDLAKYGRYAQGDDDMVYIEAGLEYLVDDLLKGKLELTDDAPFELQKLLNHETSGKKHLSLDWTYQNTIFYLLTGKKGEYVYEKYEMNEQLNKLENNNHKDFAITACSTFEDGYAYTAETGKEFTVKNMYDYNSGKEAKIQLSHAFEVKNVDGEKITIVNPYDTSSEVVISRKDFLNNFYIMSLDLSDENPSQDYINEV